MVHRSDVDVPYRVNSTHFRLELAFDIVPPTAHYRTLPRGHNLDRLNKYLDFGLQQIRAPRTQVRIAPTYPTEPHYPATHRTHH